MTRNTLDVPAHIAERIEKRKQNEAARSTIFDAIVGDSISPPRISIRASRFRLVEGGVETPVGIELDVVVVGANPANAKMYFGREYDPNAADQAPDCFSDDGIAPHARSREPQSETCAKCPHNVLGSKINPSGAKSKRCGDFRYLAVVPANDPKNVYQLTIPVGSMKNMREYIKFLGNYGVNPEEVVTQLSFDDEASAPRIVFTHKGYLNEKPLSVIEEIMASDEVLVATRQKDISEAPALAASNATETLGHTSAAQTEEKPAPEPEPKAEKPKPEKPKPEKPKAEKKEEPPAEEQPELGGLDPVTDDATPEASPDEIDKVLGDIFNDE